MLNYCEEYVPYTRIHEHKHFTPWEHHEKTLYQVEYSKETGADDVPYYPKRLQQDKALLMQYRQLAQAEEKVFFLGRLATYRYMDMHHVIGESLEFSRTLLSTQQPWESLDRFPNQEP